MIRVEDVRDTLDTIADPCSLVLDKPMSIVELGLIERIEVDDAGRVEVALVLTDPTCWYYFDICKAIESRVGAMAPVSDVVVMCDTEAIWTDERMQVPADRPLGAHLLPVIA